MADSEKTFTQAEMDAAITEATSGLKANRDEVLKEAKRAKDALKNYEGIDPDEFKRLKTAAEEADRKKALAEGDFNTLKAQMADRHAKELEARDGKVTKLTKALERRLVEAKLAEALAKHEADPKLLPLLQLEGRNHIRVRETDDDFEEFVADEKGNQLVADGKGTPMTVDDYVSTTLKTMYPGAFKGTGSSGGGASKSNAGGGGDSVIARGDNRAFINNLEAIAAGKVQVGT